jgi:ribosomal protein S18 acetylase RimI-like enzyme
MISFSNDTPSLYDMLRLEEEYEECLREDDETLLSLMDTGRVSCVYVDGHLAGMTLGERIGEMDADFPDCAPYIHRHDVLYICMTTIFKQYQNMGLGKLLTAYFMGSARARGFNLIIGHATSDSMRKVRAWSGAKFGAEHADWFQSGRTATFFEQPI